MGQSMATVKTAVTINVSGISRYLRIDNAYRRWPHNTRKSYDFGGSRLRRKMCSIRGLGVPIRVRVRVSGVQMLAFDFANQLRYNICYTIL